MQDFIYLKQASIFFGPPYTTHRHQNMVQNIKLHINLCVLFKQCLFLWTHDNVLQIGSPSVFEGLA